MRRIAKARPQPAFRPNLVPLVLLMVVISNLFFGFLSPNIQA